MRTLILGMGNTLLSDDGIGIITKRYLEQQIGQNEEHLSFCQCLQDIDYRETSWGGFRIIDLLAGYDYCIIIDSIKTNTKPLGYIHHLQPADLLPTLRLTSYHDINFITALHLAQEVGVKVPSEIDIFAIEINDNITIHESISHQLWNSIYVCSNMVLDALVSKKVMGVENEHNMIPPINYIDQVKRLYDVPEIPETESFISSEI